MRKDESSKTVYKVLISLLAAGLAAWLIIDNLPLLTAPEPVSGGAGEYYIRRVIDGDTVVADGLGKVRLLGIDTPERGEAGFEPARDRLAELIGGRWVTLLFDTELTDRYGRTLGYPLVELEGVETAVCPLLVAEGHAEPLFYDPNYRFRDEITAAVDER